MGMNELKVQVAQNPGTVQWNFDELCTALEQEMKSYEAMVYDDENIKVAKADVATLRKLKTSVEDRRKEIKKKCLEPYEVIEEQAKVLTGMIEKPIDLIQKQITDYEDTQRKKRKEEILAFIKVAFAKLPDDIAAKLRFKIYDEKWENASATKKSWKDAIKKAVDDTLADLSIINETDPDYRDAAMDAYKKALKLSDAMQKAQELQRQKEIVLENERRRQEEEKRREEARRQMEERNRIEREHAERIAAERKASEVEMAEEPELPESQIGRAVEGITRDAFAQAVNNEKQICEEKNQPEVHEIRFIGDSEKLKKVLAYIKYIGADYEV